jgi:predicted extracellular nuclease
VSPVRPPTAALALLACVLAACQAAAPAPLVGDDGTGPAGLDAPVPGLHTIAEVQGSGTRSPYVDQLVTVRGIVVGNFAQGLGGVFIQSERPDADPATAEGLYLQRDPQAEPPLRTGDRVEASGRVVEMGDGEATLTALRENVVRVLAHGALPKVTSVLDAPATAADWERYEGMRVAIGTPTITGNESLASYGELEVSLGMRQWQPTELARPGSADAQRIADDNARRRLLIDDARLSKDPRNLWFLPDGLTEAQPYRAGELLGGAVGVIDQRRGEYRLQLTQPLIAHHSKRRPDAPFIRGKYRIASFNLHNLFNGDGHGGGFPTERGAQTREQYQRQLAKLVATVRALRPDIATLHAVENDGTGPDSTLAQFVAALNAAGSYDDYRYVDSGAKLGNDLIRVAIIYRASRATPLGRHATLTDGPFATRSRAPLAQAFALDGHELIVVANHFKSKGCGKPPDEGKGEDADRHDGQGCFNAVRVQTARRLDAWLKSDPLRVGADTPTLLIGDLNAYAEEDPLVALREAGWRDAFAGYEGPRPYSFVFDGLAGRLDHALVNAAALPLLRGATEWHVNADEAEYFDYRNEHSPGPWRSSDHDPMLLGFSFAD